MIHSFKRAYHHIQKFLGHAYREGRKYARGFDQFMNAAGRTVLTLQPLLDAAAPGARRALTQWARGLRHRQNPRDVHT